MEPLQVIWPKLYLWSPFHRLPDLSLWFTSHTLPRSSTVCYVNPWRTNLMIYLALNLKTFLKPSTSLSLIYCTDSYSGLVGWTIFTSSSSFGDDCSGLFTSWQWPLKVCTERHPYTVPTNWKRFLLCNSSMAIQWTWTISSSWEFWPESYTDLFWSSISNRITAGSTAIILFLMVCSGKKVEMQQLTFGSFSLLLLISIYMLYLGCFTVLPGHLVGCVCVWTFSKEVKLIRCHPLTIYCYFLEYFHLWSFNLYTFQHVLMNLLMSFVGIIHFGEVFTSASFPQQGVQAAHSVLHQRRHWMLLVISGPGWSPWRTCFRQTRLKLLTLFMEPRLSWWSTQVLKFLSKCVCVCVLCLCLCVCVVFVCVCCVCVCLCVCVCVKVCFKDPWSADHDT